MSGRFAFAAGALMLVASPAPAQQEDEQLWLQANANLQLAPRTRLTFEQIARFGDRPGGLYTTETGALVSHRIAEGVELSVGYRHVSFHNGNNGADENRLRQQLIVTRGPVVLRLRLDERFHPDGDEVGFRLRPMIRYNHKLNDDGLALFASHESFYLPNSTDWGQREGYERMRNSVGVSVPITDGIVADAGYLNQYRPERSFAEAQMDHALSIQVTINLGDVAGHSRGDD